jgi:hypothetical protein
MRRRGIQSPLQVRVYVLSRLIQVSDAESCGPNFDSNPRNRPFFETAKLDMENELKVENEELRAQVQRIRDGVLKVGLISLLISFHLKVFRVL